MPPSGFTTVLRRAPFAWFTLGQTTSTVGDKLHDMALVGLVGARPESSALALAAVALVYCVPFLLVAPIAGTLVDRWNRRRTLIGCDLARAVVVVLIPGVAATAAGLSAVLLLVGVVFVLTLLFNVAKLAAVPEIVPRQDLLAANAVTSLLSRLATAAGIVGGGAIVAWAGWTRLGTTGFAAGFYLNAATFVVSVLTLLQLPAGPPPAAPPSSAADSRGVLALLSAQWRLLAAAADLARCSGRTALAVASAVLLGLAAGCLYVVIVVAIHTQTSWGTLGVGYVVGLLAGGIVLGSIWMGTLGRRLRPQVVLSAALVIIGALIAASARPFDFAYHGPLSVVGGAVLGPMMIAQDTLIQLDAPALALGRVFALRDVLLNVTFGLTACATGLTITALNSAGAADPFRPALMAVGVTIGLSGAAAWYRHRVPETAA